MSSKRNADGTFPPKTSGNPGGRRKASATFAVRMLAQEYTEESVLKMAEIMRGDNPHLSLRAAELLLERGWGKPTAAVEEETLRAKLKLLEQGQDPDASAEIHIHLGPDLLRDGEA